MAFFVVLINGFLGRLDGWGKGDGFLPFKPFSCLKTGGINYARYAIGFFMWAYTLNPMFIATYALAVSIPYGEDHWWMKGGLLSWFCIGCLFGAAASSWGSFAWGNSLWCGMLLIGMKFIDMDQAWLEFWFYSLGTLWIVFK